jgi:predicted Zn-dependent protease
MSESEALKAFKEGLKALRRSYSRAALEHMKKAVKLDKENPFYLSYLGLALALTDQNWAEAEDLCYMAVRMKRNQPELYLNLAEVYLRAGRREDAIWILNNGLQFTKQDRRLATALTKLGVRGEPVLSFLDRKNFLNRQLGRLRRRLSASSTQDA